MHPIKEKAITNFELSYDGMYHVKWDSYRLRVFLPLNTILKMLELEGLSWAEVDEAQRAWKPLTFNKVTLVVWTEEIDGAEYFLTSDFSDEYMDKKDLSMIDIDLRTNS